MLKDTRSRNEYFANDTIAQYLSGYAERVKQGLDSVSRIELERAKDALAIAQYRGGRIFVGGNGGSAAISDHLHCDFVKGTKSHRAGLCVHSLLGGMALYSAIANDLGFEHTLSYQLECASFSAQDCLILISSSGSSKNILAASSFALRQDATVISMTGFDGGELNKSATIKLHVNVNNYGVVEDCHQALMHALAQFHYLSQAS